MISFHKTGFSKIGNESFSLLIIDDNQMPQPVVIYFSATSIENPSQFKTAVLSLRPYKARRNRNNTRLILNTRCDDGERFDWNEMDKCLGTVKMLYGRYYITLHNATALFS